MPKYQLGDFDYEEEVVIASAKKSNLSVSEYIKQTNLKKVEVDVSRKSTAKEINKDIISIANNVSMYDDDVRDELVSNLYTKPLEKLKREKNPIFVESEETKMVGTPLFRFPKYNPVKSKYKNSLEFDQENYFGKEKYNQYKKYTETGVFDLENYATQDDIMVAMENVKQRRLKDYNANIDDKKLQENALEFARNGGHNILKEFKTQENTGTTSVNIDLENYTSAYETIPLIDPSVSGSEIFIDGFIEAQKKDKDNTTPTQFEEYMPFYLPNSRVRENKIAINQGKGETDKYITKFLNHSTTIVENAFANLEINKSNFDGEIEESTKTAINLKNKALKLDKADPNYNEKIKNIVGQINTLVDYQTGALNNYNSLVNEFTGIQTKYMDVVKNVNDYDEVVKSLMLDYSAGSRTSLSLEIGALESLSAVTGLLSIGEEALEDLVNLGGGKINFDVFNEANQGMLDYTESVKQYKEASLPVAYEYKDMKLSNFGENMSEILAENSFSVIAALSYGGVLRYGKSFITVPQANKALGSTFFAVETGGYFSRQDIGKKNAKTNIAFADNMLAQKDITPESFQMYQQQKDDALRVLNQGEYAKAFSGIAYGTIAKYFEKFGTMRIVRNFALANKATGGVLAKSMKGTYSVVFNLGTEYLEEAGTLAGHNIVDNLGGANVSIFKGLDADFSVNVLVSSLGIQGPSVARNLTMGIYDIGTTRNKKIANRKRAAKMAELGSEITYLKEQPPSAGAETQITVLEKEMDKLVEEASLSFTFDMAELAQMGDQNLRQLFEFDRELKALDQDVASFGQQMAGDINPEFYKRKLKETQQKKKKIIEQMDALREVPNKQNADFIKSVVGDVKTSDLFYYNYYESSKQLAEAMGQEFNTFKDEGSMKTFLDEQVKEGKITQDEANQLIEKFKGNIEKVGASGSESSIGIIIREDNVVENINNSTNDFEKSFIAYTLFHEMGHQNDKSLGLFEGGKFSEENKQAIKSLEEYVEDQYKNNRKFTKEVYDSYKKRLNSYKESGKSIYEITTLLGELQNYGAIEENSNLSISLQVLFNKASISYFGQNSNLFRFRDAKDVAAYVSSFRKGLRNYTPAGAVPEEDQSGVKASEGVNLSELTPEQLVKIIKRGQNPKRVEEAYEALTPQFDLLALKALNYDTRKGDIDRDSVIAEARKFLPGIVKRFNPKDSKFSTFVTANMRPKQQQIYEATKTLQDRTAKKLDSPDVQELAGDVNTTTNTENVFVEKIDVLGFATVAKVADKIKALVKVVEGDKFKNIIKKYAGKVGSLVFDIPAKKIMEGGANLAAVTKYTEGMPAPAEAQNIQRFFNAGENTSKFIKTLSLYNVAAKTGDIDKRGENIEVSRDTYGYAIGLKGLPLDYFYEDFTDPRAFSKDPEVYKLRVTNKKGRSLGLTSQTNVKRLKPEFRKPTPKVVEQLKNDLGITQKNEANVYSRDIGQLLKGVAKVYSINAALSGAQRVQEAKLKTAPAAEKQAIKQQTADITAAQSKAAFSEGLQKIDRFIMLRNDFQLETKGIDGVLSEFKNGKTYNLGTETGRKQFLEAMPTYLFPTMPQDFWIKDGVDVFTGSNANYKLSMSKYKKGQVIPKGKKVGDYKFPIQAETYNKFRNDVRKLAKDTDSSVFGKPVEIKDKNGKITQKANWQVDKIYTTVFGNKKSFTKKLSDKQRIKKWNKDISFIHKVMWERFSVAIRNDKTGETARAIGSYLKLTANDKKSWHRLGAQMSGYSKKITKREKGKEANIEFEHAMPATSAYLYLMHSILDQSIDFKTAYERIVENYKLIVLDKAMDDKLTKARTAAGYSLQKRMPDDWSAIDGKFWQRYFNSIVFNTDGIGINPNSIVDLDGVTFADKFNINSAGATKALSTEVNQVQNFSEGVRKARVYNKNTKARGMSAFDFDETVGVSQNYVIATKDGETKRIASDRWPFVGDDLLQQGWKMDFTDFNKVTDGKPGPLMQKMKNQIKKYGPKNVFILTARAPESQQAIHEYLKTEGINIPLENITGLGNSTGEAKALWMLNKFAEGYNDMYFVDDALPNVAAVKNVLEQLDIKSKVVQAKINFSEGLSRKFNDILEVVSGIDSQKRFDFIKARKRGAGKGKFRLFIPPSHEDFVGLLYNFLGRGREGDAHREFFEEALVRPLNRANREHDTARQSVTTDYKNLNKQMPEVKKKLIKKTPDGDFVYSDAIRVYLWDKHGYKIPGLSEIDQVKLVELVKSDSALQAYAETINTISKQEKYVEPTDGWDSGDIRMDLDDATGRIGRAQFFEEFSTNADVIFSKENLNKIEAGYGKGIREALEDMLYRIKTGRNKPTGQSAMVNKLMNWLNGSVGSVMFFNMRSALLQQMSIVNYINFADNNIYAAAKAFANQKQYWADWAFIFNSDMLKQRRGGIMTDVNGAELAADMRKSKSPHRFLISKLLELGFLPTQIGDNIAIATGGASYYRNRINTYLKQGLSQKEAEAKAFTDFQDITQSTQQSARPDMVSQQQASVIGKVILNFQNVTSQFNRLGKKAFQDIYNRRITKPNSTQLQSDISNAARITYYFAIQNAIFYTLQTALFAMMFDDDEEDVNNLFLKKRERLINGSIDSVLRGTGLYGSVIATLKNVAIAFARQRDVNYNPDESAVVVEALNLSPVLGIKARKIVNAEKTLNYNKKVIDQMETFDIDNPQWSATTSYVEGFTNLPLNRLYNKTQNVRQALNNDHANWERTLMFLGWSQYNLNITNEKMDNIKNKTKRKGKRATSFTF